MRFLERLNCLGWLIGSPYEVRFRYDQLYTDLADLAKHGLIPRNPQSILDVGSGSGAGSCALRLLFFKAKIAAVDSAEANQNHPFYLRRKPPASVDFYPLSLQNFLKDNPQKFDLVICSRLNTNLSASKIAPWRQQAESLGKYVLDLTACLAANGTLLVSRPNEDAVGLERVIRENLQTDQLFAETSVYASHSDTWIALSGLREQVFSRYQQNPDLFLTDFARNSTAIDPYQSWFPPEDW